MDTFIKGDFSDQILLCELFLHERACPMEVHSNPIPYLGDIQLREFNSFVTNHMHWWSAIHTIQKNEETSTLWFQSEPQSTILLRNMHMRQLQSPKKAS